MTAQKDDASASGGSAGLSGYLYQAKVSTWLALELIFQGHIDRLVLEGVSQEDAEAALKDPEAAELDASIPAKVPLHVQIKSRTSTDWTPAALKSLLTTPRKARKTPAQNLQDQADLRYLLVTNAPIVGAAKTLATRDPVVFPDASKMPSIVAKALPPGAAGRVGVVAGLDDERLEERITARLRKRFKVPEGQLEACYEALWRQALARMARPRGGDWTRAEIEALIADHDGLPNGAPAASAFVPPTNYGEFVSTLDERHAVIITGSSGTGKTTTAEALLRGLLARGDGFREVRIEGGPEKLHAYASADLVVFMIEDPWGRVRADPAAEPWNDAIVRLLATAGPRRKFIITSRSDVLKNAQPKSLPGAMTVWLRSDNYLVAQKTALFNNRWTALPRGMHSAVDGMRRRVLETLDTPDQIDRYFRLVADGRGPREAEFNFLVRCLEATREETLDTALLHSIRVAQDELCASLVWGLFQASMTLSTEVVAAVKDQLGRVDPELADTLGDFIDFLVAGQHLRQRGAMLSYQHPLVQEGLRKAVVRKPNQARATLARLVGVLLDGRFGEWGELGAARILAAAGQQALGLGVDQTDQDRIDARLVALLREAGPDFEDDLRLAARAGSTVSPPAVIRAARWLRSETSDWPMHWTEPTGFGQDDYVSLSADPDTAALCGAYVRRFLAYDHGRHPPEFAIAVAKLAPDIAADFLAVAETMVTDGFSSSVETVLTGARGDLPGLAGVAEKAIVYLDSIKGRGAAFLLDEKNGVYDGETANRISEDYGSEGWSADYIVRTYVERLRAGLGWTAIIQVPRMDALLGDWISQLPRGAPSQGELQAMWGAAVDGPWEGEAWGVLTRHWRIAWASRLEERLAKTGLIRTTRQGLLEVLTRDRSGLNPYALGRAVGARAGRERVFELAAHVRWALNPADRRPPPLRQRVNLRRLVEGLASVAGPEVKLLAFDDAGVASEARSEALQSLSLLSPVGDPLQDVRLAALLIASGRAAAPFLEAALQAVPETDDAVIAALLQAVDLAANQGLWPLVESALTHRFADVIERALGHLAPRSPGVLPQTLQALADLDFGRVKRALLAILRDRPLPDHNDVLVRLTGDRWSNHSPQYDEDPSYPFAQEAAELLAAGPRPTTDQCRVLHERLNATDDPELAKLLVRVLLVNAGQDEAENAVRLAATGRNAFIVNAAGAALVMSPNAMTPALADAIPDVSVTNYPPRFAANLAEAVAMGGDDARVERLARILAAIPARRALLLCLYLPLVARDAIMAADVLKQLDDGDLAAAIAKAAAGQGRLARDALHPLGSSRVTDAILDRHGNLFEIR